MQDVGKGCVDSSQDAGVAELTATLDALSVRAGAAIKEGGVQDSELCEVLTQLEIVSGRPVPPAAVVAAQSWATLEDQEDIAEALAADAKDALTERMAGIVAEEIDPSDDEKELNGSGDAESGGVGRWRRRRLTRICRRVLVL